MIWHPVTTTLHVYLSWKTDKLLWLPIRKRIRYKVACTCFNAINGSGLAYLSELPHVYTLSRTLRSFSDTRMLKIQQYKRKTHGLLLWTPHLENTTETCLMVNFLILFCSLVFRTHHFSDL